MITSQFGKHYNSEPACISLTSWRARIHAVSTTIYSLRKNCPGFHICLVLSEHEFPKKEAELPNELVKLCNNNMCELLWIYPNLRALKKVLPTMTMYRNIPIISADDDCFYTQNYAQELYDTFYQNQVIDIVTYHRIIPMSGATLTEGPATLYKPNKAFTAFCLHLLRKGYFSDQDDMFMSSVAETMKLTTGFVRPDNTIIPWTYHTTVGALNPSQYNTDFGKRALGNEYNSK